VETVVGIAHRALAVIWHVRLDAARLQAFDEGLGVVGPRQRSRLGQPLAEGRRRLALGRSGG
jgi:hypothetical protein